MEKVRDAMLHHPTVHRADLTIGEAQAVFADSTKTHLLLLVRDDVAATHSGEEDVDPSTPAARFGALEGRTVAADVPVEPLRKAMAETGLRRIAVVDDRMRLLGLLCLKRSRQGFCTDDGVAAMRAARRRGEP